MIKVGLVSPYKIMHGLQEEKLNNPPKNIKYVKIIADQSIFQDLYYFPKKVNCDLIESLDVPCFSEKNNCLYYLSVPYLFFKIFDVYFNRNIRADIFRKIARKNTCKKIIFMTNIAKNTFPKYSGIKDKEIFEKIDVVHPGFKLISSEKINKREKSEKIKILAVGKDFYGKGFEPLVRAFNKLSDKFDCELNIYSNLAKSTYMKKTRYPSKYHKSVLKIIQNNEKINSYPLANRKILFNNIYPSNHIFILPTYQEMLGTVNFEATTQALPVITTDYFSGPEVVDHGFNGFLLRIFSNKFYKNQKKYWRNSYYQVPKQFIEKMTNLIYPKLKLLLENDQLRKQMSKNSFKKAKKQFSIEQMNKKMKKIYEESV